MLAPPSGTPSAGLAGRLRRALGGLARILLACVVALLMAEGAVRALGLRVPTRGTSELAALAMAVPHEDAPGMLQALTPGAVGTSTYPELDGSVRTITYRINEQGFRDDPVAREKPRDVFRIAMLGDSVTYGTGVDAEDSLPAVVERELAVLVPGRRIEVVNCGIPATNTGQQVAHLVWRVLDYAPDLVVITTTIVDASGYGVPPRTDAERTWQFALADRLGLTSAVWEERDLPLATPAQRRTMALRRHSALADLVASRLYGALRSSGDTDGYRRDWAEDAPGWTFVRQHLRRAKLLSAKHDFELVVTHYPALEQLGDYPFAGEVARLDAFCREQGIPFHSLLEPLRGLDATALRAHAHDRHPGPTAHRLVGRYLAEQLLPYLPAPLATASR